jgi:hypothetical protein
MGMDQGSDVLMRKGAWLNLEFISGIFRRRRFELTSSLSIPDCRALLAARIPGPFAHEVLLSGSATDPIAGGIADRSLRLYACGGLQPSMVFDLQATLQPSGRGTLIVGSTA